MSKSLEVPPFKWNSHENYGIQPLGMGIDHAQHHPYTAHLQSLDRVMGAHYGLGFEQHGERPDAEYHVNGIPQRLDPKLHGTGGYGQRLENGLIVHTSWTPGLSRSHNGHYGDDDQEGTYEHSHTASINVTHDPEVHGHAAVLNFENHSWEPSSHHMDGDYSLRFQSGPLTHDMHRQALQDISRLHPMTLQEHHEHEAYQLEHFGGEHFLDHVGDIPTGHTSHRQYLPVVEEQHAYYRQHWL